MDAREEWIKFRCSVAEKERFKAIARAEGIDVSALIRRRVFAGAEEILAAAPAAPSLFALNSEGAESKVTVTGARAQHYSGTTSGPGWPE